MIVRCLNFCRNGKAAGFRQKMQFPGDDPVDERWISRANFEFAELSVLLGRLERRQTHALEPSDHFLQL